MSEPTQAYDPEAKPESEDVPEQERAWGKFAVVAIAVAMVVGFLGGRFLTPTCEGEECPAIGALQEYRPPEPARIFDAGGNLAGQLSGPKRIVVELEAIPRVVRDGYIAVEDRRFLKHDGVDLTGVVRALFANVRSGGIAEGGSTITMQLARNVFGPDVLSWNRYRRKLSEVRLARRIEAQLDKEEILAMYLNQIYLGDGVYGVETAAQHYFGKPVAEVSTREAALLIGLAKNPEGYNPRRDPFAAHDRIETILNILVREEVVSAEEAEKARAERVQLTDSGTTPEWGKNAYYLSAVRRELRGLFPDPTLRQGLRVHTGLDRRAQAAAVDGLVSQIHAIEGGRWGRFRHEAGSDSMPRMELSPYLQGMVVAMDPESGLVTTLVGGRDYDHSEFDRAFQSKRQPGSAFKPIVYAAALSQGTRLSDRISTEPVRLAQRGTPDWEPGDHVTASELTVRNALVQSSNSATVRVGQSVGVDRVARQAQQLGISTKIPPYPSVFLGAADVIPAELVAAFAAFGNGGNRIHPHFITRVEDPDGRVIYQRAPYRAERALDPRVAFLVLDVMRDVVRRGTGWRVGSSGLSYPAAGKTGTTNDSHDVWFIGMTPRLLAGVWIGFDDPRTIVAGGSGGDLAAPVWASFMEVANRGRRPVSSWTPPPGVIGVTVDALTGFRVTQGCPSYEVREEYFLSGSEPTGGCAALYSWDTVYGDSLRTDSYVQYNVMTPDTLMERLLQERRRYLDSLDNVLRQRDTLRFPTTPRDTLRIPTAPRDTLRIPATPVVPTNPRDTLGRPRPPDSMGRPRPDTIQGPQGTGPGSIRARPLTPTPPPPPDTTRGGAGGAS